MKYKNVEFNLLSKEEIESALSDSKMTTLGYLKGKDDYLFNEIYNNPFKENSIKHEDYYEGFYAYTICGDGNLIE